MKFTTFESNGASSPGVIVEPGQILDLKKASQARGGAIFSDMLDVIAAGADGIGKIGTWIRNPPGNCLVRAADVRLRAPLPRPNSIRDFANYELHVQQAIAASLKVRARAAADPEAA